MSIRCGSCKGIHESVAEVKHCYAITAKPGEQARSGAVDAFRDYPLATDAQAKFLRSLLADRTSADLAERNWATGVLDALDAETLGKRDASFAITRLQGWERTPRTAVQAGVAAYVDANWPDDVPLPEVKQAVVAQDGMYRNPDTGEIFKVQWNRASGDGRRLYAKGLVMWVDGRRHEAPTKLTAEKWDRKRDSIEFQYAPGAVQKLRPEWRMTLAEAQEFGALYGTCVRCGRTLTREESIERSMGPVCAGKRNWA